jgi:exopolysaccharide biosynthesis predicted pyruvyltransferase EpsI
MLHDVARHRGIVTDRLHGVIFALLTGTPCLAISTSDKKIAGFHLWLGSRGSVRLAEPEKFREPAGILKEFVENMAPTELFDAGEDFEMMVEHLHRWGSGS